MVKSICVVGRDADAWITARVLQRFLGANALVSLSIVELPSDIGEQEVYPSIPSVRGLHKLLGLSESDLIANLGAVNSLGNRFVDWSAVGDYYQVFDTYGLPINDIDFVQYWARGRQKGLQVPYHEFSLAVAAAKRNKFVLLNEQTSLFSKASYSFNIPALPYLKRIATETVSQGITRYAGDIAKVVVESGELRQLVLADGQVVSADLFIDASGPKGELITSLDQSADASLNDLFPLSSSVLASADNLPTIPSYNHCIACDRGWLGVYPTKDKAALVFNYDPDQVVPDEIPAILQRLSGMSMRDGVVKRHKLMRRGRPWVANCIAVGGAAANLDSVNGVQLHVLHLTLSYLMALFPVDDNFEQERRKYAQKVNSHVDRIVDFQLGHYVLNGRDGDPLWQSLKAKPLTPGLRQKLSLFSSRGVLSMQEDETFQEEDWYALFCGNGILPQGYDLQVANLDEHEQIKEFQKMLSFIAHEADQMPDLSVHLGLSNNENFTGSMF
ncbi:tryptophan 7-halogenase [Gilvimarinus chinensis]|uniref:tryptophan 7-halogenase n=1 Tax=Gilvimarinus chinensis TaxID=396005 RepID=UPI000371C6ED|nr:tryptophan 7-halogenase [Gilvimarinus chinensis]